MTEPSTNPPTEPVAPPPIPAAPRPSVWQQIKEHKVIQWAVAYFGTALAIAQTHDLLSRTFDWTAYCYGLLGETADAQRIFAEMQQRQANGAAFGAGGWAMAQLAVGDQKSALESLEAAAAKVAAHELDEGFFNLMALRANVMNDDVLRQSEFVAVMSKIKGD